MRYALSMLAMTAAAMSACAPVDGPDGSPAGAARCFTSQDVDNYRVESGQQIFVHSRRGGAFALDASPNCFDPSVRSVSVEPDVGSGPNFCAGDRVKVRLGTSSAVPKTCTATVSGPVDSEISGLPG